MLSSIKNIFKKTKQVDEFQIHHKEIYSVHQFQYFLNKFNLFRANVNRLRQLSSNITMDNKKQICIIIDQISDYTIWGDRNDSNIWEFFCEQDILTLLLSTMKRTQIKEVVIAVIQSLEIILSNVSNEENVNYLLSHARINEFIVNRYQNDEDIVNYFVSLLKSIAIRVTSNNLSLFFNQRLSYFPLVFQATKFYNHPEHMVRTAIQTVILAAMKLIPIEQSKQIKLYWNSFPMTLFYVNFTCYLRELQLRVLQKQDISDQIEELLNNFLFVSDIFTFCKDCREQFDNCLLIYNIIPTILSGFLYAKKHVVQLPLAPFLIIHLIRILKDSKIPDFLISALFSKVSSKEFQNKLEDYPITPQTFQFDWQYEMFWEVNVQFIFHQSQKIFLDESQISPLMMPRESLKIAEAEYNLLIENLQVSWQNYFDDQTEENPLYTTIMQLLTTKDDRLIYLSLKLLQTVFETLNVSQAIKKKFGLNDPTVFAQLHPEIALHLLRIIQRDPPLRLCTIIQIVKILLFLKQNDPFTKQEIAAFIEVKKIFKVIKSFQFSILHIVAQMKRSIYCDLVVQNFTLLSQQYYFQLDQITTPIDYLAVAHYYDSTDGEIPEMMRIPQKVQEYVNRDLAVFFMLKKIMTLISQEQYVLKIDIDNECNNWREGDFYEPVQRKLLPCSIIQKTSLGELKDFQSGQCYIIEDIENLLIATPDITQKNWAHLIHKFKLSYTEYVIEKSDPCNLFVSIADPELGFYDMRLKFDNPSLTFDAKRLLEEKRSLQKEQLKRNVIQIFKFSESEALKIYETTVLHHQKENDQL